MSDEQATENAKQLLGQLTIVHTCRRCGGTEWEPQTLTCRACGLTAEANHSKRRYKQATHRRRSTRNRRKNGHGRR